MSLPRSNYLSMASNIGLNRFQCRACKDETLHKHGKCVHCGTSIFATKPPRRTSMRESITRQAEIQKSRGQS